MVRWLVGMMIALPASVGWAATYTVTNTNNAGAGSLRQAILDANGHAGADSIVFAAAMNGATISPLSALPTFTDDGTVLSGSIDADAAPDVTIDGELLTEGNGLSIVAEACEVRSVAVVRCPSAGIAFATCSGGRVQGCHIGVRLGGASAQPNRGGGITLYDADANTIGGTSSRTRNIIATGLESNDSGIWILGGNDNVVIGNYIGLRRNGSAAVGSGKHGILIQGPAGTPAARNRIGGTDAGAGNLFGGLQTAMELQGATDTRVLGNVFGLAADGDTLVAIDSTCIFLWDGTTGSRIGGATAAARNVFAGGAGRGLDIFGPGTEANRVEGNYFGTNVAGTAERDLSYAVYIRGGAGAQTIGGSEAAGNFFTPSTPHDTGIAVTVIGPSSSIVRNNTFGILPSGTHTTGMGDAVSLTDSAARVEDNTIAWAGRAGVWVGGVGANPAVFGNEFDHCDRAVWIQNGAHCRLGNLGNASAGDDGGNVFSDSARADIWNDTANFIRAEGNDFGTTDRDAINARIVDRLDDPARGRVDFDPLIGGISPTGQTGPVVVGGAAAISTAAGAEIAFSLSAPAEVTVTVLNLAGRPVATVVQERGMAAGVQRVVWNGQTLTGTRAPGGTYLVRVTARSAEGAQSNALTVCSLRH